MKMNDEESKRLRQIFDIRIDDPSFIKDLVNFRKRYKIPSKGFKDIDDLHSWEFDIFTVASRSKFARGSQAGAARMRRIISAIENGKQFDQEWLDGEGSKVPAIKFAKDLDSLRSSHRLPPRMTNPLYALVTTNNLKKVRLYQTEVRFKYDSKNQLNGIELTVDSLTRKRDLDKLWRDVLKPMQKHIVEYTTQRVRPSLGFKIGQEVELMINKGVKDYKYMADRINKKFAKELNGREIMDFELPNLRTKMRKIRNR
jgi:hypothetical protein